MSDNFSSSIARELRSGEKLLWQGRPRGGIRLRGTDWYQIPFSLLWCVFVFPMAAGVFFGTRKASIEGFFYILLAALGLYSLLGRFFVDAIRRKNTAYALTSSRAIIAVDFFGRNVQSINVQALPEVSVSEKSDGSGTILFGAVQSRRRAMSNPWTGASSQPAFEMIEKVRNVYNIIESATQS